MAIYCCKGCVAPKRYPGCHSTCQEYIEQKETHEKRRAEIAKQNEIDYAIMADRGKKVYNALKDRRYKKV